MKIKEIILHCSATKEGIPFHASDVDSWHKARGFSKIGYHYFIDLDGTIEKGREEWEKGAHCVGRNSNSIGICYCGGLDSKGNPKDTRTEGQKHSMWLLVKNLMAKYGLGLDNVFCHNQFAAKACPCFSIHEFREEMNKYLGE